MSTNLQKVPKRSAYFLAALPFVAGCIICTLLTIKAVRVIMSSADSFTRVIVPGTRTIKFEAPGTYTIFFENRSVVDGVAFSSSEEAISGIRCTLRNADTGDEVAVRPSAANMSYSFGSREGRAYFEFTIPAPGSYRLEASFPFERVTGQRFVFAIGQGFMKDLFQDIGLIFTIIAIFFITTVGSITAAVVIYMRRSRAATTS